MRNPSNNCSMCQEIDKPKGKYPLSGTIFCGKLNKYIKVKNTPFGVVHINAKTDMMITGCRFEKKGLSRAYRREQREYYSKMGAKYPREYEP